MAKYLAFGSQDKYKHIQDTPWTVMAALGLIDGVAFFNKYAENRDVDGTEEVNPNGTTRNLLTSAETIDFVSTSGEDGAGTQTGLNTIVVTGLDGDYLEIAETLNLNGTTPVTTTNSYLRCNRVYGTSAGSAQWNVGTVTGTFTTAGTETAVIPATKSQTSQSDYTVPADKVLLLNQLIGSIGRGSGAVEVDFEFCIRLFGTNTWRVINEQVFTSTGSSIIDQTFIEAGGFYIPPKTDVRMVAEPTGGSNIHVNVWYSGWLFDKEI